VSLWVLYNIFNYSFSSFTVVHSILILLTTLVGKIAIGHVHLFQLCLLTFLPGNEIFEIL